MPEAVLFSIIESPTHPNWSPFYKKLQLKEVRINSMRKALKLLKKQQPDYIVAEFFYGYGNNYAGVNISNLDVMLHTLEKYSPATRVIVLVDKHEKQYVEPLNDIYPLHSVLMAPISEDQLTACFTN